MVARIVAVQRLPSVPPAHHVIPRTRMIHPDQEMVNLSQDLVSRYPNLVQREPNESLHTLDWINCHRAGSISKRLRAIIPYRRTRGVLPV